MISSCNIVSAFCSNSVQKKILHLYSSLEKQNLIPKDINFAKDNFNLKNKNLFFVTFNKETENSLRELVSKIDLKICQVVIISSYDENYFDFAIEYNICNIIHIEKLNEIVLLGILRRVFNNDLSMESFFESREKTFDKYYSICGNICLNNLIENTFADFIEKIENSTKSAFIINCHEIVTNALAYGVLGITAQARDRKLYDIGKDIEIPESKKLKIHLLMNEDFYGISVTDFGGTLTIRRILERIRRQSVVAGETIPRGIEDYTGRGLAILSHHGLLTFSIKHNEFTVVSLISDIKAHFEKKPISILATEF